jgi:DNA-binding response OmpR family regulator
MARILSISYDPALLATRQLLLEQMGYTVVSAHDLVEVMENCHDGAEFDLIVLGHSIPHKEMIEHCRQCCSCPVLVLTRRSEPAVPGATLSVESFEPKTLMAAVNRLLRDDSRRPPDVP